MTPEHWQEVKSLYHALLEADPSDRRALLGSADLEVRREVESLLAGEDSSSSPLDRDLWSDAGALFDEQAETQTQLGEGVNLGQYQIRSLLGRGGMGEVYLAHDRKLGRDVAIKTLPKEFSEDPEHLARFRREACVLASLNHPNIASIYGLDESAGVNFLVLEFVEGETLAERVKRTGPIPVDEALRVMSQVADGLGAAHRKSIIHRDVKPANIKVTPEGQVKVLDFGLAKVLPAAATTRRLMPVDAGFDAGDRRILGTPLYMSPEQVRGQDADHQTDIWAFGCVLYEVLTATPALKGRTLSKILAGVTERAPDYETLPRATPVQVRRLIQRCLAKDLSQRLQDIGEARRAIEEAQECCKRRFFTRRQLVISVVTSVAAVPVVLNVGRVRERWFRGTPRIRSIAVLPLANLSGNSDQEYFSDGMTESLIIDLAKIGALKVISRTSVMAYRGTKKPLREIAEELSVDAVLEGSVLRSGDRIRITAKLIDAKTRQSLWAESYNRDLGDVLMLQSEVARAVAHQVRARLTPQEQTRLASARVVNPSVHDAYLKGKHFWRLRNTDAAMEEFESALKKDQTFALAYAGISTVWAYRAQRRIPGAREKAMATLQKALALDNNLADVHAALGIIQQQQWDWPAAEASFRRAIELNPNEGEARAHYASLLHLLRRPAEAMAQIQRAMELDPHHFRVRALFAMSLNFASRYRDAEAQARLAVTADRGPLTGNGQLRLALLRQGKFKEVAEIHSQGFRTRGFPEIAGLLRRAWEQHRDRRAFEDVARQLESRWGRGQDVTHADMAALYDEAGLPYKSLEWGEKALQNRDPATPYIVLTLRGQIPEDSPRFQAILRALGLP